MKDKKPVRVLHVLGALDRGGAETVVMNLYRNINREKIQFDFIIHTDRICDYTNEVTSLGGKIYTIPKFTGLNILRYRKEWKKFFENHPEYKIMHAHIRSTAILFLGIARKNNIKTISHSHNTSEGSGINALVKRILEYGIRYKAEYFLACSKQAGNWLFGRRVCQKDNFSIMKNGICIKEFRYDKKIREIKRKEFGLNDEILIGHIGRFHPQKNHDFIIEIYKEVYRRNSKSMLMLIGEGELKKEIEEKVERLGLKDNVIFTGVREDIPQLLQAMDLFLFPSLYEGLGIVAVEAQAAGLPCIVSDVLPEEVFVTDLIKGIGLDEEPNKWVDNIFYNLENHKKDNRLEQNKSVEKSGYDIEHISDWIEEFYYELLS